jgi:hypothetical protein
MKISKTTIAKTIQEFYDFCGYEIDEKQIVELSKLMLSAHESLTNEQLFDFIYQMKLGKLGMIYRTPISIMVAFNMYLEANIPVKLKITTGEHSR